MNLELGGKTVVVCGGASGIGRCAAEAFAREGTRLAILDWNEQHLAEAEASLHLLDAEVITHRVDVSDPTVVDAAHQRVIDSFGRIDVAVNNAGIITPKRNVEDTTDEDWASVIGVNLTGVFNCIRAQVRFMRPRGEGAIINMASGASFGGAPGSVAYTAAKHGIVGITRTVALELARAGVRVNAIAPGTIDTPLNEVLYRNGVPRTVMPVGRNGRPDEVADAILWLASPRASLAVGTTLILDGGFTAQ